MLLLSLVWIEKGKRKKYTLNETGVYRIGRSRECDIIMNDVQISRKQAEIKTINGRFVVINLGRAPVKVGTKSVSKNLSFPLVKGSFIHIGSDFKLEVRDISIDRDTEYVYCINCHREVARQDFCKWCGRDLSTAQTALG